jgi:2,3-bisphosphoglycerate-dependent phosphoglycerate mutase
MRVEVIFETHSLTEDNEVGRATGWLDGRLSERGKLLAAELGERRRHDGLSAVFVSDLGRAVETAEIAFGGTRLPVYREWRLRECNYGAMNGILREQRDREGPQTLGEPFPGGESWREAVRRVMGFLDELARERDRERVLVIGHMATWFALECAANGASLDEIFYEPFHWKEGWTYNLSSSERSDAAYY